VGRQRAARFEAGISSFTETEAVHNHGSVTQRRLPVAHDLFHVGREVRIEHGRFTGFLLVGFRECKTLRDRSSLGSSRADNRQGLRMALDHDLRTGLHTLQNSGEVARRVGFTQAQDSRLHTCHPSVSPHPDAPSRRMFRTGPSAGQSCRLVEPEDFWICRPSAQKETYQTLPRWKIVPAP
jgi:hypothetical protein